MNDFHGIRELIKVHGLIWINPTVSILFVIHNLSQIKVMIGRLIGHRESPKVQHNCHDSGCRVEKTKIRLIERVVAKSDAFEVDHTDANSYILNSGVLYLAKTHRH